MAISLPWVLYGALMAFQFPPNSPISWMPTDFPARQAYEHFAREFEGGEVLIASWDGCTIDNARLDKVADELLGAADARDAQGRPFFERVIDGRGTVQSLTSAPLSLTHREATTRIQGSLLGKDGKTTCFVVVFTEVGGLERGRAIEVIRETLERICGVARADQKLVGPIMDGYAVDQASTASFRNFAGPSLAVMLILARYRLRSWWIVIGVLGIALYAEFLTLAILYYAGDSLNAILIVMPPLVLAIAIAGGIHFANYYLDAMREGEGNTVARRAVRFGWVPCTLSAGTTAVGMGSLMASEVEPIRAFGGYSAFGVMAALGLTLYFLPHVLDAKSLNKSLHLEEQTRATFAKHRELWQYVYRWRIPIIFLSTIFMLSCGWGVIWLRSSVRIETLLPSRSQLLRDYAWIESHVVPLVSIEVCLEFPADCSLLPQDRVAIVRGVEERVRTLPAVQGTLSAASFLPDIPSDGGLRGTARRAAIYRGIERHRQEFVALRYLSKSTQPETYRITARVSALNQLDYGDFLASVRQTVEPALSSPKLDSHGVKAIYTGVMPLVHEIQRSLMASLFQSFLTALVMVTVLIGAIEQGVLRGLLAMLPNVFPILIMFGLLGWFNVPLDIGTVMTASVAFGMAIDGTLHFLTFFRRGLALGESPAESTRHAYIHCAAAMTESSLIVGLGMLVFALSPFQPGSRFAWMVFLLLMLALFGDLVFLPALLSTRWVGRMFAPRELSAVSERVKLTRK
jgi:uncharacterized protein